MNGHMKQVEVVIIGAGMAGLAAGRRLLELGIKPEELVILEARDRIGGRIFTENFEETLEVDLGASWVHGLEGNPILDLLPGRTDQEKVSRHLIQTSCRNYWTTPCDTDETLYFQGHEVSREDKALAASRFSEMLARLKIIAYELEEDKIDVTSLKDGVETVLQLNPFGYSELEKKLHEWYLFKQGVWMASRLEGLSFSEWAQDSDWGDFKGPHCVFKEGFSVSLKPLEDAVGTRVFLNQEVVKVNSNGKLVAVTTQQGETFHSKAVLCTFPLGVLKERASNLFEPALSAPKVNALNHLRMGTYNKVALLFEEAFWSHTNTKSGHFIGLISEDPFDDYCLFLDYFKCKGLPMLVAFSIDGFAKEMEEKPDREVVARAMVSIRKMFPKAPEPKKVIITRWNQDPYARGSYSYLALGARPEYVDELNRPEANGRVFFAGEAESWKYQGTTHGAYVSGIQQAQRLFESLHPISKETC